MHKIYAHAREVLVWLGDEADLSGKLFRLLKQYVEEVKTNEEISKKSFQSRTGHVLKIVKNTTEHIKRQEVPPSSIFENETSIRMALLRLCRRSYWTRAWVIQECLNAKNVTLVCGGEYLPHAAFPLLGNLCSQIRREEDTIAGASTQSSSTLGQSTSNPPSVVTFHPADRVLELTRRWYIHRHDGLESLLQSYQGSQCRVLHDKVYAFLGLSSESREFPVDYNNSLYDLSS